MMVAEVTMRTTVAIDDDVLQAARQRADSTGETLGQALSALARETLTRVATGSVRNGVTLLPRSSGASATLEEVKQLQDELP